MRNWLIAIVVLVIIIAVLGMTVFKSDDGSYEIVYAPVEQGPITMSIETSGTVQTLSTVEVGCEVTGKIVDMVVEPDELVHKEQIICRIDPELMEAERAQAVAELARAESALEDAKLARDEQIANLPVVTQQAMAQKEEAEASLVDAEYSWKRVDKLFQAGDATEVEWVAVKAAYLRAQAAVKAANAGYKQALNNERILPGRAQQIVEQAKAALSLAQASADFASTHVARCTITSPIDGIVLRKYFDEGTTVNATFQTPPLYLLAQSLDRMKVSAKVSESDIAHIEKGQVARFTVEGRQSITFEDRIKHRYNQPEIIQNVVTYTVDFEVDNDERHTLIPGLSVNVEIVCVDKPEVVKVANSVLRFKPPLSLEERQMLISKAQWPERPEADAKGEPVVYCSKGYAWKFDETAKTWTVVPLWLGVTDNLMTEVLVGANSGDQFVKKFIDKSESGFSLKEAMKLADPANRTL